MTEFLHQVHPEAADTTQGTFASAAAAPAQLDVANTLAVEVAIEDTVAAPAQLSVANTSSRPGFDNAPIGIFDSGYGGLTVAREIMRALPEESIVYLGDTERCPYGPRSLEEVDGFVQQIGAWLVDRGVKLIVIACNTGTAAGLAHAQQVFTVPVIGVVEPVARAAVIATKGTIESGVYSRAIRNIDAGITVFSVATPRFVEIAEMGVRMATGPLEDMTSQAANVYIRPAFEEIAREYLEPLRRCDVDSLVLGCTHFPLLKALIGGVMGHDVELISSATETARDVVEILTRQGRRAAAGHVAEHAFFTTGNNVSEFERFGSRVRSRSLDVVQQAQLGSA